MLQSHASVGPATTFETLLQAFNDAPEVAVEAANNHTRRNSAGRLRALKDEPRHRHHWRGSSPKAKHAQMMGNEIGRVHRRRVAVKRRMGSVDMGASLSTAIKDPHMRPSHKATSVDGDLWTSSGWKTFQNHRATMDTGRVDKRELGANKGSKLQHKGQAGKHNSHQSSKQARSERSTERLEKWGDAGPGIDLHKVLGRDVELSSKKRNTQETAEIHHY